MSQNKKPVSRKEGLVVQDLNGEVLVYDLNTHKAHCLNETSALVWNACDGTRDLGELREYASAKMNSSVTDDLIWLAIDQLKKEDLLIDAPDTKTYFAGMSRRQVIKRIGVGTAIAIPIVTGLVAPPAAHAASCGTACQCDNTVAWAAGQVCTTAGGGGTPCAAAGGACNVCHSTAGGRNSAGTCQLV